MNIEKMFEQKMEGMMEQYMEMMMTKMFSKMFEEPQVAKAEVVTEVAPKVNKPMSIEEWEAKYPEKKSDKVAKVVDISELNWAGLTERKATFNMSNIPSDIWLINFLTVKKFDGKYHKGENGEKWFTFKSANDCRNFLRNAPIIRELSAEHYNQLIAYYTDRLNSDRVSDYEKAKKIQPKIDEWTKKRDALK
jgi:hypothetical protein